MLDCIQEAKMEILVESPIVRKEGLKCFEFSSFD